MGNKNIERVGGLLSCRVRQGKMSVLCGGLRSLMHALHGVIDIQVSPGLSAFPHRERETYFSSHYVQSLSTPLGCQYWGTIFPHGAYMYNMCITRKIS